MEKNTKNNQHNEEIPQQEVNELETYKKKCEEYLNNWKRERADFLNYKKDEVERITVLGRYEKELIIESILPILDSIDLAQKQMPDEIKNNGWSKGFLQIQKQIKEFLKQQGIEEIETRNPSTGSGLKFNPETMEIIEEAEIGESGTVVEELQKGYKMGDMVIRPAKVKVTK